MLKVRLLLVLVLVMFSSVVFGQTKMAVIDYDECVRSSMAGKAMLDEMSALEKSSNAKLKPYVDELVKLEQEYVSQEKVLTDSAKKAKIDIINKKRADYETVGRGLTTEFQKKNEDMVTKIRTDLEVVVKAVGDAGKYDVIYYSQFIIYGPNIKDITQEVIKKYDEKYKVGK